jgi:hypothetical protein
MARFFLSFSSIVTLTILLQVVPFSGQIPVSWPALFWGSHAFGAPIQIQPPKDSSVKKAVLKTEPGQKAVAKTKTQQEVLRDFSRWLEVISPASKTLPAWVSAPLVAPPVPSSPPALRKAYTEPLGRLISAPGRRGVNDAGNVGIFGTDLGASFEWNGLLVFLFGDTWAHSYPGGPIDGPGFNDDSLATTTAPTVGRFNIPRLNWHTDSTGRFTPLRVPGISHGGMEVPVEGISIGGVPYVFFVSGWTPTTTSGNYSFSVLAHLDDLDINRIRLDHTHRTNRFLNVSIVEASDGYLYIFGAGNPYRQSSVFLARVAPENLADRSQWLYFRGTQADLPIYGSSEDQAADLIHSPCVGELSVRRHEATGLYLMAYNCQDANARRGYHLRTARNPWGPWSQSELIYDVSVADGGYGVTQHIRVFDTPGVPARPDDGLGEPEIFDPNWWGGEYGPYLVPRWFSSERGVHTIVYTHSSWNPYKVHLMQTALVENGVTASRPIRGAGIPRPVLVNGDFSRWNLTGWQSIGTPFVVVNRGGRPCVSTQVPNAGGDAAMGAVFQDFTLDSTVTELRFSVFGGRGSVKLYHRGEVVRETRGPNSNTLEVPAVWNLQHLQGEQVRLVVDDTVAGNQGYIGVCGFSLH